MQGLGRRGGQFKMERAKPAPLPPQANPWWWHPYRLGVVEGPRYITKRLEEVDPDLRLVKNQYNGNWQVFLKSPKFRNPVCWGWKFLFPIHPAELGDGTGMIARLYEASERRWGSGKAYFDAIRREMEREKEKAEAQSLQDSIDQSMEVFNHSQISVAMRGKSNGSKFSTYQA